ncbi:hypothetical protein ABIC89_005572 [Variovorax boronicumulans]|uniref:hypothetical protein n=1 Tax=Variovorax boronicumulans TaxID=436515 RepID=UPI00339A3DB4
MNRTNAKPQGRPSLGFLENKQLVRSLRGCDFTPVNKCMQDALVARAIALAADNVRIGSEMRRVLKGGAV